MKNKIRSLGLFNLLLLPLLTAHATIIDISENPDIPPGPVVYISDASGWPTPLLDPTTNVNVPIAQIEFGRMDPIRIAHSIDLGLLDRSTDAIQDTAGNDILRWSVGWWYEPLNGYVDFSQLELNWDSIDALKSNSANTRLDLWTDLEFPNTHVPLASGDWFADIFFNDQYHQVSAGFSVVPTPATLTLFAMGLPLFFGCAKKSSKKDNLV